MGKLKWMSGVAAVAMMTSFGAAQAATAGDATATSTTVKKKKAPVPAPAPTTYISPAPVQTGPTNAELAARLQALEDALAARDDRATSDRTRLSTLEQSYNSAAWSFDNGRPTFASGDGRFTLAVRARFQTDFAGFNQDTTHAANFAGPADLSSGVVMRRAYFGIEGKAYSDFAYELRLNAGGSNGGSAGASGVPTGGEGDNLLNKAVVTYTGIPNWHFNVGVLEPAFMFEGTTSSASLVFLERPEIDNIAADSFGAGDSRRGVEIGWSKTDALWAGDNLAFTTAFTGGKTGTSNGHGNGGDEQTQVLGRASDRLWTNGLSNIQIGASAADAIYTGNAVGGGAQALNFQDRPEIRVDGTRLISTGAIAAKHGNMIAFDAEGNIDNFFLGGEWAQFNMDRQCGATISPTLVARCASSQTNVIDHPRFSGWYVEGSWIITGETKVYSPSAINNEVGGFNAPIPSRPFSLSGGSWGAWELAARYSNTVLNWHQTQAGTTSQLAGILGGDERVLALGVNWYLNRNIRLMLDDNIVTVVKGTAALPNRDGQSLNIVGIRLQYAN